MATGALREIGAAAINLAGAGLQKLGGFLVDSVKVAGDFQSQMQLFGAAAGKDFGPGTAALGEFKDLFIQLGKDLPVSTAEVQDAAIALVKGGIDPAVIKAGALRDSLNFAAAAGMGLADAAELTVKQLGTFVPIGASVEQQTKFMAESQNLLVKAAGASTLDVKELGTAMLAAGGQARAAGLDYNEFVTTMGLISPAFGSAAEAGTSFKNFLTRMNPATDKAKDAMADLGLYSEKTGSVFFDASGKFVGMQQASESLKQALSGLSDQQRIAALQTIFGNDAMGAATALAGAGADGFAAFAQKMSDANGVAGQAEATQQGFNFQLENMKGSLEALQITIGSALLPVLASLIGDYLTPGINAVMEFADSILNADDPIFALVQAVDALVPGLGSLIGYLATIVTDGDYMNDFLTTTPTLFQGIVGAIQAAVPMMQQFAAFITDNLTPVLSGIAAMVAAVVIPAFTAWAISAGAAALAMLPIIAPIVAIGLAVGLLVAAWQNDWGGIQEKTAAVWAFLEPTFTAVANWLQVMIPIAIQATVDFVTTILIPAFQAIWDFISINILPLFGVLWTWLSVTLPAGVQVLANFWNTTLLPALNAVWAFLTTYVIPLFTALVNLHLAVLGLAVRTLTSIWNTELLPAITGIYNYVKNFLGPIFDWLTVTIFTPFFKIVNDISISIIGTLYPMFQKLSSIVKDEVAKAFNNLNSFASGAAGALHDIGAAVHDVIGWINDLIAKLNSVSVPDWLQGHSPPPMANWFSYIGESVKGVNQQLPTLAMNLAAQMGPGGGSISTTASTRSFTYAPNITTSGDHNEPMSMALASSLASV